MSSRDATDRKPDKPAKPSAAEGRLPLPFPPLTLERSLLRLYGRLLGEVQKRRDGQPQLVRQERVERGLAAISDLLDVLGTGSDLGRIRPIKTWPKIGPFDFGEMQQALLVALKSSPDEWMTVREIADSIARQHALELNEEQRAHFLQKLREALHRTKNDGGFVEPERSIAKGDGRLEQRWRLNPAKFRRR